MKLLFWLPEFASGFAVQARSSPFCQVAGACATVGGRPHAAARSRSWATMQKAGVAQATDLHAPALYSTSGRVPRRHAERYRLRDLDTVDRCRIDTARIPGTFASRIQAFDIHALVIVLAPNPDRR